MSFVHVQIIAFKWFFLIMVKTHLHFLFNRWVFFGFSCISVNPCNPGPDLFSQFSHEQVRILVETRVAQIKSPSFLYPAVISLNKCLCTRLHLWCKNVDLHTNYLADAFLKKNASTTSVATDFLQLFAQEMSVLSDVITQRFLVSSGSEFTILQRIPRVKQLVSMFCMTILM